MLLFSKSKIALICLAAMILSACEPVKNDLQVQLLETDLLLNNGVFLDPRTQTQRKGSIIIRDGKIIATLDSSLKDFPGQEIDLKGKFVIPGLIDLHTHSYGNMAPGRVFQGLGTSKVAQYILQAGVTGFLDLFGDEDRLYNIREKQQKGEIDGADIFVSLSCVTAPKGHCSEYGIPTRTLTSPQNAIAVITDLAKRSPDVIKIVYQPSDDQPSIDKATFASAVSTAQKMGIKTIIHIKTWQDVRDAMDVGATAITHVPRGVIPADLPQLMAKNKIIIIPTLTVHTDLISFLLKPEILDAPLARKMASEKIIAAYRNEELIERYRKSQKEIESRNKETLNSVGAMAKAGVTVLLGTDSGNRGTVQGYSVHRELMKLVGAGLTPWQALAAGTTLAGDFLNIKSGVGIGDQASLVILKASPLEDIKNTQKIDFVIHHGKIIPEVRN